MKTRWIATVWMIVIALLVSVPVASAQQPRLLHIDKAIYYSFPDLSSYTSTSFSYENEYGSVYEVTIEGTEFSAVPVAVRSGEPNPGPFRTQTLYLKTVDQVYEGYPDWVSYSSIKVTEDGLFIVNGVTYDKFITYDSYMLSYTTVQIIP
ncbi:hypothetical protein WMW72_18025 [Paenibacillus filicis]|uniref:NEAT domain-containing protein n=1 Tax=Paenibacillus filicis TaxID=669464 RepID=A0ABU9DLS6_9BACL